MQDIKGRFMVLKTGLGFVKYWGSSGLGQEFKDSELRQYLQQIRKNSK